MTATNTDALTVTQLTRKIRSLLEDQIGSLWVEGEISNHRAQNSGHQYFTLKDEGAQLSCVLFRGDASRLPVELRDGMQVQLYGELSVYEQRGSYQIIVKAVQPKGLGSLQARFEALKRKLAAEGLFEHHWKKEIAKFPRCVALVTSPTGAAVRDMLNILTRRAPWLHVLVYPVRVQGAGAELEIAAAIDALNRAEEYGIPVPDTIVVGRGGGSLEDLWNFNEEVVARAIFASSIPVISAVGHEIDFTIADFVADLRAPTPSAAAELLAPDAQEMQRHLAVVKKTLESRLQTQLEQHTRILDLMSKSAVLREPARVLREVSQMVDDREADLSRSMEGRWRELEDKLVESRMVLERNQPVRMIESAGHRVSLLAQRMDSVMKQRLDQAWQKQSAVRKLMRSLGPDAVLKRGFSVTTDPRGSVVHDSTQLRPGDMVVTRVSKGSFASVVTKPEGKGR